MAVDQSRLAGKLSDDKSGKQVMAFQIIRHAFRMVFGNFGQALRVSIGPYLVLIAVFAASIAVVGSLGGLSATNFDAGSPVPVAPGYTIILFIILAPTTLFVLAWVAVAWHRFILLEEYSGMLPRAAGLPIWPYVGRSMLYGLILALAIVPLGIFVGAAAMPLANGGNPAAFMAVSIGVSAIGSYLWFRMALALPSVAIGKPISLSVAWDASRGHSGAIFGAALLLAALNVGAGVLGSQAYAVSTILGVLVDIAIQWTILMLGVSILTTFYGHLIEGRDLPN